jgi:poly(ADP-ribose) glycohydrolase ARH3
MRVAPVALAFYRAPQKIPEAARRQAAVTGHTHPLGAGGAQLQAQAVHLALKAGIGDTSIEPDGFLDHLRPDLPPEYLAHLSWLGEHPGAAVEAVIREISCGVAAHESVPAAIWAFLTHAKDAEKVIVQAANMGGDTDTIAAMAGAMAGAYHGASALPRRWLDGLENGEKGRDYVISLADELFELGFEAR